MLPISDFIIKDLFEVAFRLFCEPFIPISKEYNQDYFRQ